MIQKAVSPICAFDISADGTALPISGAWPAPEPVEGAAYRWLHFDLAAPGLTDWVGVFVPSIAGSSLLQRETRPRCDLFEDGLILNLRGVNKNPGASPDDMVSLRI